MLVVAAAGAGASALITALSLAVPVFALFGGVLSALAQAFVYAAFIAAALMGVDAVRGRWLGDGGRVWAAMVVIGFFLFILMFVVSIPLMIVLSAGPLAPYVPALTEAGGDQAAVMAVMLRFLEENPGAVLAVTLFYAAIWFLVTSRFYLAAPASVDLQRILTFETWPWTKGAMLRIAWARLLLLAPAYILAGALGHLIGRAFGIDSLNGASIQAAASANAIGLIVFDFIRAFIILGLYAPLEAGLSSYLYRGLKPSEGPAPPSAS